VGQRAPETISGRRWMRIQRSLPKRAHSSPTMTATASEATNRASTNSGRPGKATAVAISTTGLIAGADSRKVSAAAGGTPRDISPPATGTEPHSHPGSSSPAAPATGTAAAWFEGRILRKTLGGT